MERVRIRVTGVVQGVGFRWWVQAQARELGLVGYAMNLPDGGVEILAQGPESGLARMLRRVIERPSSTGRPGWVDGQQIDWFGEDPSLRGFGIR